MVRTIHWKAVKQYFTVVPFVVQFHPVCNFRKFINFGLRTVRTDRIICCKVLMHDVSSVDTDIDVVFFVTDW